ncbi:hypothetical protein EDD37DRAFT_294777 [Exophiala viscosa]|uniref:Protein kinase domain-containing protein n=1 Tax=Exophiala viscosa TaxID=2486360 RepID=A0AAN6E6T7_9EURO|nr:hypothetical protein EDD36DRAFT_47624 [Exophiala viscosa]KAI1628136.1 hypothetical protein EDD37DRAFT_294777 [Exophiala viscosa]
MSCNNQDKARQLWADCLTSRSLAQLIAEVVLLFKEDWQPRTSLHKGFQQEVKAIERVWLSLLDSLTDPDIQMRSQMVRLRRCYDDYAAISVIDDPTKIVPQQQIPGEKAEGTARPHCPKGIISTYIDSADNVLWSASKLESVLEKSRLHTSRLLSCTPIAVLTNHHFISHSADTDAKLDGEMDDPNSDEDPISPVPCGQVHRLYENDLGHVQPHKTLQMTTLFRNGRLFNVLLEQKDHDCSADDTSCSFVHKELLKMAKRWQRLGPASHSGVLAIQGLVKPEHETGRYAFVYHLPFSNTVDTTSIVSLQDLMEKASPTDISLRARLRLAKRASSALATLHAGGILHKNITRRSMLFFDDGRGLSRWESPYLVNCDFSRRLDDDTSCHFSHCLERNISRHPACQGVPNEAFTADYDVYALGVLLLEIGLWCAAIDIFAARNEGVPPTKSTCPVKIQNRLKLAAAMSLPELMGAEYASIVMKCLSAGADHVRRQGGDPEESAASICQAMEGIGERSLRCTFTGSGLEEILL